MYSVWARFRDILQYGAQLSKLPENSVVLLSELNRGYREQYITRVSIEPKIEDMLPDHLLDVLARQLDRGRNEFRNSQVHSITTQISGWGIGVPDEKRLRGFGNDVCGKLLCPSTQDWENLVTRDRIRNFEIPVTTDDFPKFLWEGGRVDSRNMNKGFLRGELLVKVLLCIMIGPAAARPGGQSSGVRGYADLLHLHTLTVPSLAFAATVARSALSADSKCRWTFKSGIPGFNNLGFYQQIISTVKSWKDDDQQSLLTWWNKAILSHVHGGHHSTVFKNTPTAGSAAALMMEQARTA